MKLEDAKALAELWIEFHKLTNGWSFKFDNAKCRFGLCSFRKKTISLSRHLVELNSESEVEETILHEIAHALVGPRHGHDLVWKKKALAIGCNGKRCYDLGVVVPKSKYILTCLNCGGIFECNRKPIQSIACSKCCKHFNFGRYDPRFILEVKLNVN